MRRTSARLADNREIIFFDAHDGPPRDVHDPRTLPATATTAEIRYDALVDEWVAVASHRQGRTHLPPTDECPLCPSTDGRHTEIPAEDYDVVVFENRFPSFSTDVEDDGVKSVAADAPDPSLFARRPGRGRCEVVCFTSDHRSSFSALTPERVRLVIDAWVDRTTELSRVPEVEQVFCFENRGEEIGVTLHHPHGQIYAYPFVTPRTRRMLDVSRAHLLRTGRNLVDDIVAGERAAGDRVVLETDHWVAFVPAAARWPVEVHLHPLRAVPDLAALHDDERDDLAGAYLQVLHRLDGLYGSPLPYIASWHQAPVRVDRDLARLHLQLLSIRRAPGKLKYLAGSESGMGVFVNDVTPEAVAERLRAVGAS